MRQGMRLAARLVVHEALHERGQLDDAGVLVAATTTEPEPRIAPAASSAAGREGRVQAVGGQEAARRAAHEGRLELSGRRRRRPCRRPTRSGRAGGHLGHARRCDRAAQLHEDVPGKSGAPMAAERGRAVDVRSQGTAASVATLLTAVGGPEEAALGRVRRPLVGQAALALERPQQDGLLAEHEAALQRPDLDLHGHAGAEHVVAEVAGRLGRLERRREALDGRGGVGADHDEGLLARRRRTRPGPGPPAPRGGRPPSACGRRRAPGSAS